ncbi:unnamed protein product [Rhizophagus irregularis]|nr:unnamed protein product [Rhizophagus irregularis]
MSSILYNTSNTDGIQENNTDYEHDENFFDILYNTPNTTEDDIQQKEKIDYENDENFFKELVTDFHHMITYTNDIDDVENFESNVIEWINNIEEFKDIKFKKVIESMEVHQQSKSWFSSLIGFFLSTWYRKY